MMRTSELGFIRFSELGFCCRKANLPPVRKNQSTRDRWSMDLPKTRPRLKSILSKMYERRARPSTHCSLWYF